MTYEAYLDEIAPFPPVSREAFEKSQEKTIRKTFKTLKQAEAHQNRLYGKYDRVTLVRAPRFPAEAGIYEWRVS
jgi:hypothetical protein